MKRTAIALVGFGLLSGVLYLGSRVWAQAPKPAPPAAAAPAATPIRTRIAVVNFVQIIKDYKKAAAFQDQINRQTKTFDDSMEPKRNQMIKLRDDLQKNPAMAAAERESKERDLKRLQREYQEQAEDFQKQLNKQNDDSLVHLYREVQEAIKAFANANDIEMVLQYSDGTNEADMFNAGNVKRKIQVGALMPIHIKEGMDISKYIVDMLNTRYTASLATPPAGVAPMR